MADKRPIKHKLNYICKGETNRILLKLKKQFLCVTYQVGNRLEHMKHHIVGS